MKTLAAAGILIAVLSALPAAAETVVVRGATIHPVSGPPIENGVLVIEGDTIQSLGADLPMPPEARVVDHTGRHLYPGFVHPASSLGLVEIDSVRGTVDLREISDFNPDLRAEVAFFADSLTLPVAVSGGVLYAHTVLRGPLFSGTSAVMRLSGWNWEDMTLEAPIGQHLEFPEFRPRQSWRGSESEEEAKKRREEALERLAEIVDNARAYGRAKAAGLEDARYTPATNPRYEALLPALEGGLPLFVHVGEKSQMEAALDWVEEEEIPRVVLVAGPDVRFVAARVAAMGIPVILNGVNVLPRREWVSYDAAFAAAAELERAGVTFAIGDGFEAANVRNLPFEAARAAAYGLSPQAALAAVTIRPAEILGIADRVGSLEPGKEASFLVTTGDPLDIRTLIEEAWIAGRPVDMSRDHHKRLYERYSNRPRPSQARP